MLAAAATDTEVAAGQEQRGLGRVLAHHAELLVPFALAPLPQGLCPDEGAPPQDEAGRTVTRTLDSLAPHFFARALALGPAHPAQPQALAP